VTLQPEADGLPEPRRTRAAACIAAGISLTVLDAAMVNIALPSAARDLGLTPADAVWVVNAYQITVVGTLIPFAALGEIAGFKRVWNAGLALFLLAALCSAMAPNFEALLAARVAQGLGGAAVMSLMSGLVRHTYPSTQLGPRHWFQRHGGGAVLGHGAFRGRRRAGPGRLARRVPRASAVGAGRADLWRAPPARCGAAAARL
jgi:MFS family permease